MEFKVKHEELLKLTKDVDIGTEWNLKERTESGVLCHFVVDIGTEWNLK